MNNRKLLAFKNRLIWATCSAVGIVLALTSVDLLNSTHVNSAAVVIAAADSSSQWKSQATVVCDGNADQVEINATLEAGGTVTLAPGTFQINGYVLPKSGSRLTGQGNATVLNLSGKPVLVADVSGVELDHFKITGTVSNPASSVLIIANYNDVSGISVHDIYNSSKGGIDFLVWPGNGRKVSQVSFVRDTADSPDGIGFAISGEGTSPVAEDITYYRCTAINSGIAPTRLVSSDGTWESGFDFAEYHPMSVNRISVIKCSSDFSWEDGYHFEYIPPKANIVIIDSYAGNSGIKPGGTYSCGFLLPFGKVNPDNIIFSGNTGSNNRLGDVRVYNEVTEIYANYTPPQDLDINPSNPSESFVRVNQGNLVGIVSTNGNYKNLVLYSSDGNPVNQQLDLGAAYKSDDGQVYVFDGTKISLQFADYAVVRLVKVAPPSAWDVNQDGVVNVLDVIRVNQRFGEQGSPGWIREDVNTDGVIDLQDAVTVTQHLN